MAPFTAAEIQAELARRAAAATGDILPEEQEIISRRELLQQQIAEAEQKAAGLEQAGAAITGAARGTIPFALGPLGRKLISGIESIFDDRTYEQIEAEKQAAWGRAQAAYPGTAIGTELLYGLGTGGLAFKAAQAAPGLSKAAPYLFGGTITAPTALGTAGRTLGRDVAESALYFAGEDLEADEMAKAVALQSGVGQVARGLTGLRSTIAPKLEATGLREQRGALGTRYGDYLAASKRAGLVPENPKLKDLTQDIELELGDELDENVGMCATGSGCQRCARTHTVIMRGNSMRMRRTCMGMINRSTSPTKRIASARSRFTKRKALPKIRYVKCCKPIAVAVSTSDGCK